MFVFYTCSPNYVCDAIRVYMCTVVFCSFFPFLNKHVLPIILMIFFWRRDKLDDISKQILILQYNM